MKTYAFILLAFLALANATISTYYKTNSYNRVASSHNAFNSKSQKNTHYTASSTGKDERVLRNDIEMKKDGFYHYQYETSNGITGMEQGLGGVSVNGANSYISPEGVEVKMTYTADENGYHPVGDHIPKIPDYILRALEYIRTHPPKDNDDYKKTNKNVLLKKSPTPSASAHKISTYFAPPTRKTTPRRQTPTTKRSSSFVASNKFTAKNQNQYNRKKY